MEASPCRPRRASSRPSTRSKPRSAGEGREEPRRGPARHRNLRTLLLGVDDVQPAPAALGRVLGEAAEAGSGGLELGPYGYMPLDVPRVGAALEARGLRIVAGTIFTIW